VVYSINPVDGATTYNWTVPSGVTLVSGQGSTLITVDFGNSFSSGNICVRAGNACGNSSYSCISVNAKPQNPVTIIGPAGVCVNQAGVIYSTPAVFGVTSYTWTVPFHAVIVSGQGTSSIKVNFSHYSGLVEVWAKNSCGTSSDYDFSVHFICREPGVSIELLNGGEINAFPNPVHENLSVSISSDQNKKCTIRLIDVIGKELMFDSFELIEGNNLHNYPMSGYTEGLYLIVVERDGLPSETIRVVVE
jgi:PKD-like domain/Secretion system C-terminal sorting domain